MIAGGSSFDEPLSPRLQGWWFPGNWGTFVNSARTDTGSVGAEDFSGNEHHLLNPHSVSSQLVSSKHSFGYRPGTSNAHMIHSGSVTSPDGLHISKAGRSFYASFFLYMDDAAMAPNPSIFATCGDNTDLNNSAKYYKGGLLRLISATGIIQYLTRNNAAFLNASTDGVTGAGWHHVGVGLNVITEKLNYWIDGVADSGGQLDVSSSSQIGTSDENVFVVGGNGVLVGSLRDDISGTQSWSDLTLNNLQIYTTDGGLPSDIAALNTYLSQNQGRALTPEQWT